MGQTPIQKAVADILRKYPDGAHRTLAKALCDKYPALFPHLEAARAAIRRATGNIGSRDRHKATQPRAPRKPGELPPLPKSEAKPWVPYVLESKRCLVLSDLHLPYHDEQAIEAALSYGETFKPDTILINGDLFDFYHLSRFDKVPTKAKVLRELECGREFFAHLAKRFPRVPITLKLGNHDQRWDSYLALQAPMLFDIEEVRNAWHIPAGIVEHKVKIVGDQRPIMLGKLMVLHGHEKGRGISSPVNPARGAFMRLLSSVLEGHGHRQSEHSERTADEREIVCRTTGCLCGLWPEYAVVNKWSLGFATVTVAKGGDYEVQLKRIGGGKVY